MFFFKYIVHRLVKKIVNFFNIELSDMEFLKYILMYIFRKRI